MDKSPARFFASAFGIGMVTVAVTFALFCMIAAVDQGEWVKNSAFGFLLGLTLEFVGFGGLVLAFIGVGGVVITALAILFTRPR